MPARREYTADELASRLERRREQTRLAVQRYRARRAAGVSMTVSDTVSLTNGEANGAVSPTPSPPVPLLPGLATQDPAAAARRLAAKVAPLAPPPGKRRLKVPDAAYFLERLEKYPRLDLDDEIDSALDWLADNGGGKRFATVRYLNNWLQGSEQKRQAGGAAPAPPPARPPATVRGMVLGNGTYVQPQSWQRVPEPAGLGRSARPMERINPADMPKVPLPERLAQARGGTR